MRPATSSGQVAVVVLCCCIYLLYLPPIIATETAEIDLKRTNHKSGVVPKFLAESEIVKDITWKSHRPLGKTRKIKPNKSSPKKYREEDRLDFRVGSTKKSIYEKKYFDYLSAELKDSPEVSSGLIRKNGRRIRRDVKAEVPQRMKRNGIWYVQPVGAYSFMVPHYIQPNDWRLQFNPYDLGYRPNLNNHYLPPVTIRTPATVEPPVTEPTPSGPPDLGMRGSFDTATDGQIPFIFDMVVDNSRETNYQLFRNTDRPRTTQSPVFGQGPTFETNGRFPAVRTTTSRPVTFSRPRTTTINSLADRDSTTPRPVTFTRPPTTAINSLADRGSTTQRPSIQHNSDDDYDWSMLGLSVDGFGDNGQNSLNTTNSDSDVNNSIGPGAVRKAPSKCAWAIANCCSHNSDRIRYYCFEQNQCPGSFWGDNVCRRFYQVALREIENYYNV
ncbi:uncharacterized protein LOC129763394 isoform X2 [Toxorhynchites rutilus septentrionalis]|uniref:uncharacterized protein LOC129763394 isoform X2 n=1 Tax=Toxorhynchites rutilus septentrionalis TaxID=329112 RepID=UPI002479F8D7|nr:uncharacterized protein LOC129763394 isoform X2 [Toxorhynchites rutilus septentrionalis]